MKARYNKYKKLYLINFISRIKWFNIIMLISAILLTILLLNDYIRIIIGYGFTWYGLITNIIMLIFDILVIEYIIEELK